MSDFFTEAVIIATVAGAIRLSVPLLVAALGETFGQRSGVLNLGVDGIMTDRPTVLKQVFTDRGQWVDPV